MVDDEARIRAALSDAYAIDREVGRGGMATVYLAEDLKHGRRVAIKVLHPDIAASLGRERFLREIEIVAKLRHRGILPLYDSGEADGLLYYVMPFVEGPTLRDRLDKEKQLAVEEALRITSELAAALDEAHAHGVIHRDIKPENVLFEGDQPLIADFGVATALEEAGGEKLTRTGVAVGTPSYMSPEQAAGGGADPRSDEYALACVLYEMLGGTPPFTGPTPQAVMARHALDPVPDLGTVRSTVPEGVIAAVERAMAKVPADRYPSAGAFAGALAKGDEKRRRTGAGRRRRELAAVVLVMAVGGTAYLLAGSSGDAGPEPLRLAVLPFDADGAALPDTAFAEALYAEVIERMVGSGAHVISGRAADRYAGFEDPIASLNDDLDVDVVWLTEWSTDELSARANTELIDANTMVSLGSTTVAVAPDRLDTAVPRLAQWGAGELGLTLVEVGYDPDPAARRAFVKARSAWWSQDDSVVIGLLKDATRIDPDYAEAWGYLAMLYVQATHQEDPCEFYPAFLPLALEAADRALELDSTLVEPHMARAHLLWEHQFNWEAGEREFLVGLEKDPDHPDLNMMYGWYLALAGRPEEAIERLDRASESHQLEWRYLFYKTLALGTLGREEEAEDDLRLAFTRWGAESWVGMDLVENLAAQGRVEDALQFAIEVGVDETALSPLARFEIALARGDEDAVGRMIDRARQESPLLGAMRAYRAGRYELVIPWIEEWWADQRECTNRIQAWMLVYFPKLIGEPRLQALMDEANIPWRESTVWAEMSD